MAAKKKQKDVEWVGGLVTMPAYITGEGEPFRPEALFWLGPGGLVLGHELGRPGELLDVVSESLNEAIRRPLKGRPGAPTRVRVESAALADSLRAGTTGIEIVCAPTPELDELTDSMREGLRGEDERSYLSAGLDPEAVGSFFQAAAELYRLKPWLIVPTDEHLLSVTIAKLGVTDAVIAVIGQMGESFGLMMFSSRDDFDAYLDAIEGIPFGDVSPMPPTFTINFERESDVGETIRKEISRHGWEVVDPEAYPVLLAVEEDLRSRPISPRDLAIAEALALALPGVLEDPLPLLEAWDGGEPLSRNLLVAAHGGDVTVSFRTLPVEASDEASAVASDIDFDALLGMLAAEIRKVAKKPGASRPASAKKKKSSKPRRKS